MALYTVHCNEISLKGGNRYLFEDRLIANISMALDGRARNFEKVEKRIFFASDVSETEVKGALSRVFGIEWFARAYEVRKDRAAIKEFVVGQLAGDWPLGLENKSICVNTKRGDKRLPFTSMELNSEIGQAVVERFGCKVNLDKPDILITVDLMQRERAFVMFEKIQGPGGLPSGTAGKVVALLSGGIDSPVASWMIMSRGAQAVFLHVHPFPDSEQAEKSKIAELAMQLGKWQGGARVYLADYSEFYSKTLAMPEKYELVLFRKFIYLLAQEVAGKEGAHAIVSGDSLGQVASQTLQNIYAVNSGLELPVFRPLIGMDKSAIIQIAQKVGTYDISIKQYKDCCSLIAVENPETRADAELVKKVAEDIGMQEIVRKTLEKARIMELKC